MSRAMILILEGICLVLGWLEHISTVERNSRLEDANTAFLSKVAKECEELNDKLERK